MLECVEERARVDCAFVVGECNYWDWRDTVRADEDGGVT